MAAAGAGMPDTGLCVGELGTGAGPGDVFPLPVFLFMDSIFCALTAACILELFMDKSVLRSTLPLVFIAL